MDSSPINRAFIYNLQGVARGTFSRIRSTANVVNTASRRTMTNTVMVFNLTDGMTIYGPDSKVSKIANQNIGTLINISA